MGRVSREGDTLYAILTIIFMVIFTLAAAFAVLSLIGGRITFDNKSVDPTVEVLPAATPAATPPMPAQALKGTLIDYGRMPLPIPEINVDEPSGAFILFVATETSNYIEAIRGVDDLISRVVEQGDTWVYYFDTTSDGSLYFGIRCEVDDLGLPATERHCQTSQFRPGQVPISFLYDHGFVSADSQ